MPTDTAFTPKPCPAMADTPTKRLNWWRHLEPQWRSAFQLAFFGHTNSPEDDELERLWQTPVLRFAGPKAAYPNLNFELTNCSGLASMHHLEILVLTNHRIESIGEVADMPELRSLFANNNAIRSLAGIESLVKLEKCIRSLIRLTRWRLSANSLSCTMSMCVLMLCFSLYFYL